MATLEDELFVEELSEFLKCPICLCCLSNPYQTKCGHRFCHECIKPVLHSRNNVCPIDRIPIDEDNTYPDNAVKLQINQLKIRCPQTGCEWVGELSDKPHHLAKCTYICVPCPLCGSSMCQTDLLAHEAECPQRRVNCEFCAEETAFERLKDHHKTCASFPMVCKFNCTCDPFKRGEIEAHYTQCPRAVVSCKMASFGCIAQVERGEMGGHLIECAPQRAGDMAEAIVTLQRQVSELLQRTSAQERVVEELQKQNIPAHGQFTWRIDNIKEKVKAAGTGECPVIYSPLFLSREAGYLISLCIYPAGDNNEGYLSVYFVINRGPHDEVLPWPFSKRVLLSLINTLGGQSIVKDIQPDIRLRYFQRPENEKNVGYGYPKFIALSRLLQEDAGYVQNGAIFIKCRVYE